MYCVCMCEKRIYKRAYKSKKVARVVVTTDSKRRLNGFDDGPKSQCVEKNVL